MRRSQVKLFFVCCSLALACNFQYGFSSTYFNTPVASFKHYLNESITAQGFTFDEHMYEWMWNLLLNVWFIGFFFGIWLSPILNDRYGRKVGFVVGTSFSLLASILRFLGILFKLPELLFVGRIIVSITAAVMYQSLILYIQECSPTHLRGMMSFTSEMSYASMCVLGLALGTDQIFGLKLSCLLGFAIIPCTLAVVVLLPIPETPKFLLITKNNRKAAIKSILFFHGDDANVENVLREIEKEGEEKSSSSPKEIFATPYLRKALLIASLAMQNTVSLWSILLSSTHFLRTVKLYGDISAWSSTAMGVTYVMGTIVGFIIVESAGIGPVSWILCTELVPQRHRSMMQSLCYSINTLMVVISTFTVLPLYGAIGAYAFLILYIVPCTLCIIYLYKNLPETMGREIHEIVADLRGSTISDETACSSQISVSSELTRY
ncbi:Solute carrier family 2, facilitated glucose transporter member 1 [Toxocara canis]|uniref:Solute carrier family 2, facilitated glucose transporter member 1 n=1 Tax=Toxocara canis TaxID=6265 RepID=A0A0B2UWE0_TOXCA|nr:Solute carrier family 2, facilitated glucose transporter member 1 [Toxocara canis]